MAKTNRIYTIQYRREGIYGIYLRLGKNQNSRHYKNNCCVTLIILENMWLLYYSFSKGKSKPDRSIAVGYL